MATTTRGVVASRIDELPEAPGGIARLVRTGLGISAFGVQIFDVPPGVTGPEHDESETGQEELYVGLQGAGAVIASGTDYALDSDHVVLVAPGTKRALTAGPGGMRVLCVGGVPGAAYVPPAWTEA
ncbi:MAG TPA: hypothetical protein VGF23_18920 [Gaiellaceae bacterium]